MKLLLSVVVLGVVAGCSAYQPRQTVFDPDAPTMRSIYSASLSHEADPDQRAVISNNPNAGEVTLRGYTRDAAREAEQLFPTIPNPTLVMYVYPHVSAGQVPVPGFSTPFSLYERTHYALPGELQ